MAAKGSVAVDERGKELRRLRAAVARLERKVVGLEKEKAAWTIMSQRLAAFRARNEELEAALNQLESVNLELRGKLARRAPTTQEIVKQLSENLLVAVKKAGEDVDNG